MEYPTVSSISNPNTFVKPQISGIGEILSDKTSSGRERPWRKKKIASLRVSDAYQALNRKRKATRCRDCGTVLVFAECQKDFYKKLQQANFCKIRLCPMCAWRRSLKWSAEVSLVLHKAAEIYPNWSYVMLTLTQSNVLSEKLSEEITKIFVGWKKFIERKEFKAVVGWLRVLEVTYNTQTKWHPHIHALLAVKPDYWHKQYVSQAKWVKLWRDVMKLDYDPVIDVHRVKQRQKKDTLANVAQEVGKYTVKDSDILGKNKDEDKERIKVLDEALHGRRLIAWGGELKKIAAQIKADVLEEEEDLIHILGEDHGKNCLICGAEMLEHVYKWIEEFNEYVG